ncbi:hypothetical protein K437DRAFT_275863 [Tilletiaria anomala UBC 951]|uniref:Rdx family-domain-containing protein n=1 Tax=Tilletiaria anomala (strain ATCC 24038 / CBS 436.72 / UBC 951) TaxID=1037660 RepID=A0A066VEQ1_TILAU|nr:uncharacterized protein K437DRAFT_275863 [Tilletiaria anomala UBC 951]KDN39911.1 hypothetical protein K437DRAFT_275863 [Tilletiaria anomala UBC 951]
MPEGKQPTASNCDTCAPDGPLVQAPAEVASDPSTFTCPVTPGGSLFPTPSIVIEYCDRCRWQHRATWIQTELFLTFAPPKAKEPASNVSGGASIKSIMLVPLTADETAGRFRVWLLHQPKSDQAQQRQQSMQTDLVWDRKTAGAFPELKELKQLIRDKIAPGHDLGHSDKQGKRQG